MANRPPMCPGSLLLGNARALFDDTSGVLAAGYQRLGPVFRIRAAWRQYTVVAGPEAADFMAQGLDKAHLSRDRMFGPIAREFGQADLILKEIGPRHARLRPPLAVAYSRQVASPLVPAMVDAVRRQAHAWPAGASLGVADQARRMAFAQYSALLGTEALAFRDCRLMTTYLMNVAARVLPPIVLHAPWYRRAHRRTYGVIRALVQRRRAMRAAREDGAQPAMSEGLPTLVDALASVRDPTGARLTDEEVVSYAAYGIGASIGYVGRLTAFMFYEILRDPPLHAALVAEARDAFGRGVHDAGDVGRLRLMRSVYDETLRLHSLAVGMAFDVASDFAFLGHQIRRGETLVVSPVPSSYDPANFPDPHRFDAARCRAPRNEHRRPGVCLPFGVGDRTCAAMGLVELMSTTLVATALHERAVAIDPPRYSLRRVTFPLPSPDGRLRMRVAATAPPGPLRSPTGTAVAAVREQEPLAAVQEEAAEAAVREEEALGAFPGHDQADVRRALAEARRQTFSQGAVITREGDVADAFYLIERGSVHVSRAGQQERLATLSDGDCFGEMGLLQEARRNATVTAGPDGVVVRVLSGAAFLAMVAASDLVASEIGHLLRKRSASARLLDAATTLTAEAVSRLFPEFTRRRYRVGDVIVREGEVAEEFFVLAAGEVVVSRLDEATHGVSASEARCATEVARLGPGEYFGEMGLLRAAPRNATVTAAGTREAEVLVIGRRGFDDLLAGSGGPRGELATAMLARTERLREG